MDASFRTSNYHYPFIYITVRYIALDYGEKRIGIAGSDSGTVVTPLTIITLGPTDNPVTQVVSELTRYTPQKIIIGLPLSKDGQLTDSARKARAFGESVKKSFPTCSIHYINEILTTFEARQRAGRKTGEAIDDHAAAVILEQFITEQKKNDQ